jgi:hypothetical protein
VIKCVHFWHTTRKPKGFPLNMMRENKTGMEYTTSTSSKTQVKRRNIDDLPFVSVD